MGRSSRTCSPASLVRCRCAGRSRACPPGPRDDGVGARDEAQGVGVAVVPLREVAVVAVDDRVRLRGVEVGAVPLADARAAGVGQHRAADRLEVGEEAVALDGGARLLGAGRDQELRLHPQPLGRGLPGDRGRTGDVLVGAVRARADGRRGDVERPALGAGRIADLGELVGTVGGVGTVDHRAELVEVDLDDLVEHGTRVASDVVVGTEVVGHRVAASAMAARPVARRYSAMLLS